MNIIVDVNALMSGLLKDSTSRNIIVNFDKDFYFPEPSLQKIRKYKNLILEKTGFSEFEFLVIFHYLLKYIKIIPEEEILQHWNEAKQIMERIDPEDVTIIAAALSQENSVIWSDDAHFDQQKKVVVLKTKDLIKLFKTKRSIGSFLILNLSPKP